MKLFLRALLLLLSLHLAPAFGADEAIREKILSNLSKRARESLMEEMSFQTDVPERLVLEARKQVVSAIARLDAEE